MKSELLQSYLFKESIKEIDLTYSTISIDHAQGYNYLDDTQFDLRYPKMYINRIDNLSNDKEYEYCFIGGIGKLGRKELLEKFNTDNSIITNSSYGRNRHTKYTFDVNYYQTICKSKFSLCPNHISNWHHHDRAWTYRYVESLFCKSIPIVFNQTPLGKDFLKDTFFLWDNESHDISESECYDIVEENYQKALRYWTFAQESNDA